jgi:hypothetical protein
MRFKSVAQIATSLFMCQESLLYSQRLRAMGRVHNIQSNVRLDEIQFGTIEQSVAIGIMHPFARHVRVLAV